MKAIIFDFGGTLDTDGVHWAEKFWEVYQQAEVPVSKTEFMDAYTFSERNMQGLIKSDFSLKKTLHTKISYQFMYLTNNDLMMNDNVEKLINEIADICYNDVTSFISEIYGSLRDLRNKYKMALVSNYYGNLEYICSELGIRDLFEAIVDSYSVQVRKPDPRIFQIAVDLLGERAEDTILVGDVYEKDVAPGKDIGCKTIWVKRKGLSEPEDTSKADVTISQLGELEEALNKLVYS